MSKYPNIVFFRYEKYAEIDKMLTEKKDELNCNLNFTSDPAYLNNMFDPNFHLFVTFLNPGKDKDKMLIPCF